MRLLRTNRRQANPDHPHGSRDLFDPLCAQVITTAGELSVKLPMQLTGNANTPDVREPLKPGRDVDGMPVDFVLFKDHVAKVDSDAVLHALIRRDMGIARHEFLLHLEGTPQRVDGAAEQDEQAVTGELCDPTAVPGNAGKDDVGAEAFEPFEGRRFVGRHEAGKPRDVERQNDGQFSHWDRKTLAPRAQ